jgi:SagB-type dehydrogenase family enzyme
MTTEFWSDVVLRPPLEATGAVDTHDDTSVWELYHENSKTSRYERGLSPESVALRMRDMYASLAFEQYPELELPQARASFSKSLEDALLTRTSVRAMSPVPISLAKLAAILHCAYGVTRSNEGTNFPRPFRTVPSAGALYPLEIYFHSSKITEIPAGLYHYNPSRNAVHRLREEDLSAQIASALVEPASAYDASIILFITALFERATFKYGERGYRFTLLEAGHAAQNINLAANGLGLGSLNIGGFFDRQLDELLGLDGVSQSTIYVAAIGQPSTAVSHLERAG